MAERDDFASAVRGKFGHHGDCPAVVDELDEPVRFSSLATQTEEATIPLTRKYGKYKNVTEERAYELEESIVAKPIPFDGGLSCALSVSNLDNAIAWYGEVLGFEFLYKLDDMGWAELKTPVERVTLGLSQVEKVEPKGGATLTFGVSNMESARTQLEELDVKFDGETATIPGMVKYATFFDPDGNTLMLFEDLSEPG